MEKDTEEVLLAYSVAVWFGVLLIVSITFEGPVYFVATWLFLFVLFFSYWFRVAIKWHNRRTLPLKGSQKSKQSPEK